MVVDYLDIAILDSSDLRITMFDNESREFSYEGRTIDEVQAKIAKRLTLGS